MKDTTLLDIKPGKKATITKLEGGEGFRKQLENLGLREGKHITLIAREPARGPLVIRVGNTTVTLGRGRAAKILVEEKT